MNSHRLPVGTIVQVVNSEMIAGLFTHDYVGSYAEIIRHEEKRQIGEKAPLDGYRIMLRGVTDGHDVAMLEAEPAGVFVRGKDVVVAKRLPMTSY